MVRISANGDQSEKGKAGNAEKYFPWFSPNFLSNKNWKFVKKGHDLIYINVVFICFFRSKNNIPLLQCHIVQLLESSYGRQWRWTWPSKGRGQGYRERARDRCPIMVFISKTIWKWLELCVHWYFAPNVDGDSLTQKISVIFHKQPFYKKKQEIISFISRWYCIYISIQRDVISAENFSLLLTYSTEQMSE